MMMQILNCFVNDQHYLPSPKQILTQNGHSGSFKVIYFDVVEEPLWDYIVQYNNCGLRCGGSEDIAGKIRKIAFFDDPTLI